MNRDTGRCVLVQNQRGVTATDKRDRLFPFSMTCSGLWQKLSTTRKRYISAHSAAGTFGRSRVPHSTGAGEAWAKE